MVTGTLTPEGASILREVREHLIKHPEELNLFNWECNTQACIAGHCHRVIMQRLAVLAPTNQLWLKRWQLGGLNRVFDSLGFKYSSPDCDCDMGPFNELFSPSCKTESTELGEAVTRINAFLWRYGYAPDKLQGDVTTRQAQAEVQV